MERLWALREELHRRGVSGIETWQCPAGMRGCNPCGTTNGRDDSWGAWKHIACRTYDMDGNEFKGTWRSDMNITRMGVVTNIHLVRGVCARRAYA